MKIKTKDWLRVVFLCFFLLSGSSGFLFAEDGGNEFFTIRLPDYFVELQGGQRVDLEITYKYAKNLDRSQMPDYREAQILAEDALYGMPMPNIYWEFTNREIARLILTGFPQFSEVSSRFFIHPRGILNINRGSTVVFEHSDLKSLREYTKLDQDHFYRARPDAYNILVPRPLKPAIRDLAARVAKEKGEQPPVVIDFPPFPLAGSEFTFPGLIAFLKPEGPYDAIVLPENAGKSLVKIAEIGPLTGIVQVKNAGSFPPDAKGVAEISLARTLALDPAQVEPLPLADAREKFFTGKAPFLIVEDKYAQPYRLRNYTIESWQSPSSLALFVRSDAPSRTVPTAIQEK